MAGADLVFLPWLRRGASAGLQQPDSFGAGQPGVATAAVSLTVNAGPSAGVPVAVMGPGHVTGLDERQVVRTDPAPGSRSFEPNYFPLIELDEPSLPWLFTPAAAGAEARLRPWLCLVVVRAQEGVRLDPPRLTPLRVLRIGRPAVPAAELPGLAESWAWSHAQVTASSAADEDDIRLQLDTDPARSVARLLCARVLQPDTDYIACVVPTFELGRKAGLGLDITAEDEARLAPAWELAADTVELPVYYAWEFATGAGGDFQSLAMLLRARPLPEGVGTRPIDVSESGLGVALPPGIALPLAGALRPIGATDGGWPSAELQAAWEAALAPVLDAPATVGAEEDPLLAPPLYGAAQAGLDRLDPARPGRWFERLNLSPQFRAIARLGTRVVQEHQDQLMASAWAQVAELDRVNQRLRQTQLGCWVATSLHVRHLGRMDPGVALQVLAPMQARITRSAAASTPVTGLAARLVDTGLEPAALATALRRVARPRGAINRRVQRAAPAPLPRTTAVLRSLQPQLLTARMVVRPAGPVTLERVAASLSRSDISWGEATAGQLTSGRRSPFFAFVPLGQRVPMEEQFEADGPVFTPARPRPRPPAALARRRRGLPDDPFPEPPEPPEPPDRPPRPPRPPNVDSPAAAQFRALAIAHLQRFEPARPIFAAALPRNGLLSVAAAEALARATPRESFAAQIRATVQISDASRPDERAFEPVGLSPVFPQPMVEPLTEIAQGLVLPGLDLVPPNTVVPLETNSAFIEAYLVGLNTEMGRELVWRGFPANLAATYFDRFWNAAATRGRHPDIHAIGGWGNGALGTAGGGEDSFVMLVRSELLLRYPNAVIYATRPGPPPEERQPVFTGGFAPDVRYVGFDIPASEIRGWSIVLQEHPSAPRFGIEVGDDTGGRTHLAPPAGNAALVARRTRQMPVRITLPSSILLDPG